MLWARLDDVFTAINGSGRAGDHTVNISIVFLYYGSLFTVLFACVYGTFGNLSIANCYFVPREGQSCPCVPIPMGYLVGRRFFGNFTILYGDWDLVFVSLGVAMFAGLRGGVLPFGGPPT